MGIHLLNQHGPDCTLGGTLTAGSGPADVSTILVGHSCPRPDLRQDETATGIEKTGLWGTKPASAIRRPSHRPGVSHQVPAFQLPEFVARAVPVSAARWAVRGRATDADARRCSRARTRAALGEGAPRCARSHGRGTHGGWSRSHAPRARSPVVRGLATAIVDAGTRSSGENRRRRLDVTRWRSAELQHVGTRFDRKTGLGLPSRSASSSVTSWRSRILPSPPPRERTPSLRSQVFATLALVLVAALLLGLGATCGIEEVGF